MRHCDFLVIGAGIVGAALAARLAAHGRTLVVEREDHPGYHSTGRSAAHYIASYGPPMIRRLTLASRPFFDEPADGFGDGSLLARRPVLTIAGPGDEERLAAHRAALIALGLAVADLDTVEACREVPVLRSARIAGAVAEIDAFDIDVDRLHQGCLRALRRAGGAVVCRAEVRHATRSSGQWRVDTSAGPFEAPIVVNAAGAWGDVVGGLFGAAPVGLVPKRRSALIFDAPSDVESARWPLVGAVDDSIYFKPDAGRLLGSPANQDPVPPQDVQPEALDIAIAVDRLERLTTLEVRPRRTWAGLRSFVADGEPVVGFDDAVPGLFWSVGHGGYGIQSAPALADASAARVLGEALPPYIAAVGVTATALAPARLRPRR